MQLLVFSADRAEIMDLWVHEKFSLSRFGIRMCLVQKNPVNDPEDSPEWVFVCVCGGGAIINYIEVGSVLRKYLI